MVLETDGDQLYRSGEKRKSLKSQEERNIVQIYKIRKANWICHIMRRYCLLKHGIEGKVEERWK